MLEEGTPTFGTIRYSMEGEELWRRVLPPIPECRCIPRAIALDPRGGVSIAGMRTGSDAVALVVQKLDGDGSQVWLVVKPFPAAVELLVVDALVDSARNTFVLAGATDSCGSPSTVVVKIDSLGRVVWSRQDGLPDQPVQWPSVMAVGQDEALYVAGSGCESGTPWTLILTKYSPDGVPLWTRHYCGEGSTDNGASSICLTPGTDIIVSGWTQCEARSYDIVTMTISESGTIGWTSCWRSESSGSEVPSGVARDNQGNVYVAGTTSSGGIRYVLIKYDVMGRERWVADFTGCGDRAYARALAVDPAGAAVITGSCHSSRTSDDFGTCGSRRLESRTGRLTMTAPFPRMISRQVWLWTLKGVSMSRARVL